MSEVALVPDRPPRPTRKDSPLRQARRARNWTLERTVEEIDLRTAGGHSGVTPSMLSGWELGRHVTSIGHRAILGVSHVWSVSGQRDARG